MTHSCNDALICMTWLIYVMTYSYVWHDAFICMTWLIHVMMYSCVKHVCDMAHSYVWHPHSCAWHPHSYVWHDSFIYEACMCVCVCVCVCVCAPRVDRHATILICVWHDSFVCVTWLIHMCDMTHLYVWHDSSICVTRRIHMCSMYMRLFVCVRACVCVRAEMYRHPTFWFVCDMTHSYMWHDWFICVMWLIPICDIKIKLKTYVYIGKIHGEE